MKNKQKKSRIMATGLIVIMMFVWPAAAWGDESSDQLQTALPATGTWLVRTVNQPTCSTVGGEWAVLGLSRSGYAVPPGWYDIYYQNVLAALQAADGVLSTRKYTEYSRVILALTAIGKDPADVGGYNLLTWLGDYDKVVAQGINGPVFALLALDSGAYAMPVCVPAATQASREMYIDYILARQLENGGWSLTGHAAEADVTAMVLQALAKYQADLRVKTALERGVLALSGLQDETGGFASGGTANVESTVQAITALGELKIDPCSSLFTKNGHTLLDSLLSYAVPGGGFKHIAAQTEADIMGSEQGFYALVAYQRFLHGQRSLYDLSEEIKATVEKLETGTGLAGKHADVKAVGVSRPGRTFKDIQGRDGQAAIEALSSREIVNGVGNDAYEPQRSLTRAEFAAIVVRALGLTPAVDTIFADVPADSWYAAYVGAAYRYGIVSGTSAATFTPTATITRQEAAVMTARAARLCGLANDMNEPAIEDTLDRFSDAASCADWAKASLAFCHRQGILPAEQKKLEPGTAVTRAEMADMLYRMLVQAELI